MKSKKALPIIESEQDILPELMNTEFANTPFDINRVGKICRSNTDKKYFAEAKAAIKSKALAKKLGLDVEGFVKIFPCVVQITHGSTDIMVGVEVQAKIKGGKRTELFLLGRMETLLCVIGPGTPVYPLGHWVIAHATGISKDKNGSVSLTVGAENHVFFNESEYGDAFSEFRYYIKQNRVWDMNGVFEPNEGDPYQIQSDEFEVWIRKEWAESSIWEEDQFKRNLSQD